MLQWLTVNFPVGTPSVFPPSPTKFHKIQWNGARFDGKPENVNGWVQTVLSIKSAHRVPNTIPAAYGRQVTEAIATYFTGIAADAWLNTPEARRPCQIGDADPNDKDQNKIIPWIHHRFQSHTLSLVRQR